MLRRGITINASAPNARVFLFMKMHIKKINVIFLLTALLFTSGCATSGRSKSTASKPKTIAIASFNIQILGQSKISNPEVMRTLAKIIRRFDVVAIQEVRSEEQDVIPTLLRYVNDGNVKYDYVISKRLGRTGSKEQYAFVYNTSTVRLIPNSSYVVSDPDDVFEREPFVAYFRSGNFDFKIVNNHIKPEDTESEFRRLAAVINNIYNGSSEKDVIALGDMNADGTYFNENNLVAMFPLWIQLIGNNEDTTVAVSSNTYDRMMTRNTTANAEYAGTSGVFRWDTEYRITSFGKQILKDKLQETPVWYEDLPSPKEYIAAALLLFKHKRLNIRILEELKIKDQVLAVLRKYKFITESCDLSTGDNGKLDFEIYRDIPPEDHEKVESIVKKYFPDIIEVTVSTKDVTFEPKKLDQRILCIKCHPARCAVYKDFLDTPNSSDSLASKLCPNDSIKRDINSGNIVIDKNRCVSCLLCAVNCPVNAIEIKETKLFPEKIPSEQDKDYGIFRGDVSSLMKINDEIIKKIPSRNLGGLNKVALIAEFEKKIGPLEQNWDQIEFYTWVRNCFRGLSLDAKYTGGKGMKTRSDVTIVSPFPVAIEIKSPAEGKVNGKAIRQTDDAAAQLYQKFKRKVYTCAIGQEISPEAIRKANEHKQYRESQGARNFCIPIIPSKMLFYIFLLNQEINFKTDEIELIFRDFHGELGAEELKRYLTNLNKTRKIERLEEYFAEIDQIFSKP